MAIDNFCEGKNMEEYEVLKKAAAELNEIMHAAHINASDRAVYASGMLLAMHVLTPDSLYATEDTASHYIYRHLMDFLKDQLSPEMYQMTAREFQVLTSDPERDRYLDKLHKSYTQYIFCFIYQNIFQISDGMDSIGELFGEFLKYTVQMATENGKVLTPSYISHLMAKLIHVKDTDEVLDVCAGSGGMLVAAYDEMRSSNPGLQLKKDQLRGIEINPRMAALAVSNMILRGISAEAVVLGNTFLYSEDKKYDKLLINPDFTCEENGLPFLSYGLDMLKEGGEGAVIIQDSAGGGMASVSAREILAHHTLLCSIKMPIDLFSPNAKVQTSIYLFRAHIPHDFQKNVLFVDFRNDGCKRTKRGFKYSRDVWRLYSDLVKTCKEKRVYPGIPVVLDQITDTGCDWNYETHLKIDGKVTKKDLSSEVANALLEKIKDLLKPEGDGEISADRKLFSIEELFEVQNSIYYRGMPEADLFDADGTVPVITNTALNNGVKGYSRLEACNKGNVITLSDTIGGSPVFYQEKDFIGFAHLKMLIPKKNTLPDFDGLVGRYIAVSIRKSISGRYNYTTKLNTGNILRTKISLPCKDGLVDADFIRKIMTEEQKRSAGLVLDYLRSFSEQ